MWVVLNFQHFEVEQQGPLRLPVPVKLDFKPMIGYLPVYATREAAEKEFPDSPRAEIRLSVEVQP